MTLRDCAAQQGRAGDARQCPLVPRFHCRARLTPGVRPTKRVHRHAQGNASGHLTLPDDATSAPPGAVRRVGRHVLVYSPGRQLSEPRPGTGRVGVDGQQTAIHTVVQTRAGVGWTRRVHDRHRRRVRHRSDVHHVYPRNHLKKQGLSRGRYNQIANFVLAQSEINIAIGDKAPEQYFKELAEQCAGGKKKYGGITDASELRANLRMSCLPEALLDGGTPTYDDFLEERRKLMAQKIKVWFEAL